MELPTQSCPPAFSEAVVRRTPRFASRDSPKRPMVTYPCRPSAAGGRYIFLARRLGLAIFKQLNNNGRGLNRSSAAVQVHSTLYLYDLAYASEVNYFCHILCLKSSILTNNQKNWRRELC
jgi:hypothetical protein